MLLTDTSPNICNMHILDDNNRVRDNLEKNQGSRNDSHSVYKVLRGLTKLKEGRIVSLPTSCFTGMLGRYSCLSSKKRWCRQGLIIDGLERNVQEGSRHSMSIDSIKKLGVPIIFLLLKFFNAIRETIIKPSLSFISHLLAQQVTRRKYRKDVEVSIKKLDYSIKYWNYKYE